ncbi:MAG: hypothetical protein IJ560_02240 [Alphaproteobacteria bacterium]|nr:hypothetical protein [Alphaproteobacteria bacterium]
MKYIRILFFSLFLLPVSGFAAGGEFNTAAQLLAAAKNADIQQVQRLINDGANVNYVDSTGLSIVCTALMNNDVRAAQILQMYGADASTCDRQIKQYNSRTRPESTGGLFSGLSSTHGIVLAAAGAAVVVGGLLLLTDVFDPGNGNKNGNASGSRTNSNGGTSTESKTQSYTLPVATASNTADSWRDTVDVNGDFDYMKSNNYLLMTYAYNALARGYTGWRTIRSGDYSPFNLSSLPFTGEPGNGRPVGVALITKNGVNPTGSVGDGLLSWVDKDKVSIAQSACSTYGTTSSECTTAVAAAIKVSRKYYNRSNTSDESDTTERDGFDLSGSGSVFGAGDDSGNLAARIVAGWEAGGRSNADAYGFVPNGQLVIYRTGGGNSGAADVKNYQAMLNAAQLQDSGEYVVNVIANIAQNPGAYDRDYYTVSGFKTDLANNALTTDTAIRNAFGIYIDNKYNTNTSDDETVDNPSAYAAALYTYLGNYQRQIIVNSVGGYIVGANQESLDATFENYAPVVYSGLEHLFMSVVPVRHQNGTSSVSTISAYTGGDSNTGKVVLSEWTDGSDTIRARRCGVAGTGVGDIDPWCFAAPGIDAASAVASMSGAIAMVKSAFDYMSAPQIFILLAITADGPYLGTNPSTAASWDNTSDLINYLQARYTLPGQYSGITDAEYLQKFKEVFGYGLVNLERATRPDLKVYYYDGTANVVTANGTSYWRSATNTAFRASSAFNPRGATVNMYAYDILHSADGALSLPRVWNNSFAINTTARHALYMGDVLGELKTRDVADSVMRIGNIGFSMSRTERAYADNMNGIDNMRIDWNDGVWNMSASYQHYLTDGAVRFRAMSNPVLALATDAVVSDVAYSRGKWTLGARAFSGRVTDDGLLENDPAISQMYTPARLGGISGGATGVAWHGDVFDMSASIGAVHESNTILGAYTDGMLSLGQGDTTYFDTEMRYKVMADLSLAARATFATTHASGGDFITDVSDLYSNAFAIGADWRGLSVSAAMPLGIYRGAAHYPYAEYDVVENSSGGYDLAMSNTSIANIDMRPTTREFRIAATYMRKIGEFTDGGIGFIYRINPNHTHEFGNESIFMMKINHMIGI